MCPYVERYGVCFEPAACFLRHKMMNTKAKEFVPGKQYASAFGGSVAAHGTEVKD